MQGYVLARFDLGPGDEDDESDEDVVEDTDESDENSEDGDEREECGYVLQGEREQQPGETQWKENTNSGNQVPTEKKPVHCLFKS